MTKNYMRRNFNENIIIATLILFGGVIIAASFIFLKRQKQDDQPPPYLDLPIDRQLGESGWTDIGIYKNKKYGYSFQYPARYLKVFSENPEAVWVVQNDSAPPNASPFSIGLMNVFVSINPPFSSVDEWLNKDKKSYQFEKRIKIAGYDTLVVIEKPVTPLECKDKKTAVFIKGNMFFQIETCSIDHERVWKNFIFE